MSKKNHADTTRAHKLVMEQATLPGGDPAVDETGAPVMVPVGYEIPDENLDDLELVERQMGFVFGTPTDHTTDHAKVSRHLTCNNPQCDRVNTMVAINEDTAWPVHCGGCGTVLACEHDWQPMDQVAGTLAQPLKITWEHCPTCNTDRNRQEHRLDPIDLSQVPLDVLQTILGAPAELIPQYTEQQTL